MIIENQAVEQEGADAICAHKIEIFCPNCTRDVDESELFNKVCSDCGTSLDTPEQHVAVAVTSVPVIGIVW
jgi:predicted amidophosphoribosyltransferase